MWISEPKTKKAKKGKVDFESSYPNYLVLMCFIACNIRIPYDVISGSFPVGKDRRWLIRNSPDISHHLHIVK